MNLRRDVFQAIGDLIRRAIVMLAASQSVNPGALAAHFEADFIEPFRKMWEDRFNKLETIMKKYKT